MSCSNKCANLSAGCGSFSERQKKNRIAVIGARSVGGDMTAILEVTKAVRDYEKKGIKTLAIDENDLTTFTGYPMPALNISDHFDKLVKLTETYKKQSGLNFRNFDLSSIKLLNRNRDKKLTRYQIVSKMPNNLRNKACRIMKKQNVPMHVLLNLGGQDLYSCFHWYDTKEGISYWSNINKSHF